MRCLKRVLLISTICLFLCSCVIYAKNFDETTYQVDYVENYDGIASKCSLIGSKMVTHMSVETTTSNNRYNIVTIREYMYDEGWTSNMGTKEGMCSSGKSVGVIVYKRKSLKGYYFHIGKCFENLYAGQVNDTYYYTAIQR